MKNRLILHERLRDNWQWSRGQTTLFQILASPLSLYCDLMERLDVYDGGGTQATTKIPQQQVTRD